MQARMKRSVIRDDRLHKGRIPQAPSRLRARLALRNCRCLTDDVKKGSKRHFPLFEPLSFLDDGS